MQVHCAKCRAIRELKDPKEITMKNGEQVTEGICPVCGTKLLLRTTPSGIAGDGSTLQACGLLANQ